MLTDQENELFTRVGPGTPMGVLLRRYWHPVGCSELVTTKPTRVTVMGEELVVYRGTDGELALMELRCAHRGVALDYGRVEGDCIRCPYHGWLYDRSGRCLEQPAEPEESSFKEKIRLKSYKVQEFGGLIFGYMGPEPASLLPLFDVLRWDEGVKAVQVQMVHANWFNHVENWPGCMATLSPPTAPARSAITGSAPISAATTSCSSRASTTTTSRATASPR